MDLTTWMAKHNVVDQQLADAIGVTRPYINRIRNGEVHPKLDVSLKIWDYTKRKIALEQLLPKHLRPPLAQPAAPARPRGRPQTPPAKKASRPRVAA